jgi:hypothetical protein
MSSDAAVRAGGIALIGGAIAFLGFFTFLAARFDYPAVHDVGLLRYRPAANEGVRSVR